MTKLFKVSFLIAALATGLASPVNAQTGRHEFETFFFDNEAHDNQVGFVVKFCDGHIVRGGTPTLYDDYYYYGCD